MLRLHMLFEQAEFVGLTTFSLISRALAEVQDFNWHKLSMMIGTDFANFRTAQTATTNNPFASYDEDCTALYSRKYKALGYTAWKVLVASGDMKLGEYRGFQNAVINSKLHIDRMIMDWELAYRNPQGEGD